MTMPNEPLPVDTCSQCGAQSLIAVCEMIVDYTIANIQGNHQEWMRRNVEDDTANLLYVWCEQCWAMFPAPTLDGEGSIVDLGRRWLGDDDAE